MDDMKGVISISGKGMSLSYFGARQLYGRTVRTRVGKEIKSGKVTRGMLKSGPLPSGIIVQILKGKDTTLLRNAFLAKVAAGKTGSHVGVYRRTTKERLPIEEKNVISIGSMAARPEVMSRIVDRVQESWTAEFPRQLAYFMSKASK